MIYIINPHEHPTDPVLDKFAHACKTDDWNHTLVGIYDAELISRHAVRFEEILDRKVREAVEELRNEVIRSVRYDHADD